MNHRELACVLLASAGLLAQDGPKQPRPFPVLETAKAPPAHEAPPPLAPAGDRLLAPLQPLAPLAPLAGEAGMPHAFATTPHDPTAHRLEGVVWDGAAAPNTLWASSPRWKASFDATGASFVPFLGSDAPRNLPVRFALRSVAIGANTTPASPGTVVRDGDIATIVRGDLREQYVASDAGIEQRFVFDALPQRGAIAVRVDVDGEFAVAPHEGGFRFVHELGAFTYGAAVAFDARGRRLALSTEWTGASLVIHVPAEFVAAAQLPLVIDPLVGNVTTVQAAPYACRAADVAYDASLQQYVVCWEQVFSASDSDVYLKRLDANLQPIGATATVDATGDAWRTPRVAGLNAYDKFLVVAQATNVGQNAWIAGRMLDGASGALAAPSVLLQGAYHLLAPDVGGDPNTATPTWFTVAYERVFSPTDHDIGYFQVDANGALRAAPVMIDNSTANEHSPRISKCDGQAPHQTQAWAVAYRRDDIAVGQTRVSMIAWDGQFVPFNGQNHTHLTGYAAPIGPVGLDVSSPTDDGSGRVFLLIDTAVDPQTANRFLRGSAWRRAGTVVTVGDALSYPADPDVEPSIDTDGRRFAFTWIEDQLPTPRQCVGMCDVVGSSIARREGFWVTAGGTTERAGAIVARHSGNSGTEGDREYTMVWCDSAAPGGAVRAQRYRGMGPGGFGSRGTGCGPLTWNVQGLGAIGETVTLQIFNHAGFPGWVFGFPVDVALGFCPGCRQGSTADVVLPGQTLVWQIPFATPLVGLDVSFQAFDFGAGTCLGSLAISNTADLTIR